MKKYYKIRFYNSKNEVKYEILLKLSDIDIFYLINKIRYNKSKSKIFEIINISNIRKYEKLISSNKMQFSVN